jgi:hypothetical protein
MLTVAEIIKTFFTLYGHQEYVTLLTKPETGFYPEAV